MKKTIIIAIFLLPMFLSCKNTPLPGKQKDATPKALTDDNTSSVEIISKRGDDNLVESLYNELEANTPELKDFADEAGRVFSSKKDSLLLYNQYNDKNKLYYNAANYHVAQISDTMLRAKIEALVADNLTAYTSSIAAHERLLTTINTKSATLADLQIVLKVIKTLPIINKYQQQKLPSTKPLVGLSNKFDTTIGNADMLIKK